MGKTIGRKVMSMVGILGVFLLGIIVSNISALSAISGFVNEKVIEDYDGFVDIAKQYQADADYVNNMLAEFADKSSKVESTMADMNNSLGNISNTVDDSAGGVSNIAENVASLAQSITSIQGITENSREISRKLQMEASRFEKV